MTASKEIVFKSALLLTFFKISNLTKNIYENGPFSI
jgi:hypothetical protein